MRRLKNSACQVCFDCLPNLSPKNSGISHNIHAYTSAQSNAKINNMNLVCKATNA